MRAENFGLAVSGVKGVPGRLLPGLTTHQLAMLK
jgi:hypothetical protein